MRVLVIPCPRPATSPAGLAPGRFNEERPLWRRMAGVPPVRVAMPPAGG